MYARSRAPRGTDATGAFLADAKYRANQGPLGYLGEPESDLETTVDSEDEFGRVLTPSTTSDEDDGRQMGEGQRVCAMSGLVIQSVGRGDATAVYGTTKRLRFPCSAVKQRSLQIWDWDDTLFPSTWINSQGLRLEDEEGASPQQQVLLDALAAEVEQTLLTALQLGDVVIVTNAEHGWVDQSCKKFFPTLHSLVSTLKVVSARTTYEEFGIFSPLDWKVKAFEREMSDFAPRAARNQHHQEVANIISLGDSIHEREAVLRASETLPFSARRVKSVKLQERPELTSLKKTHDVLRKYLKFFIEHDGDLDLMCLPLAQQIQFYTY